MRSSLHKVDDLLIVGIQDALHSLALLHVGVDDALEAQQLDGDERGHGHQSHHAEGVPQNSSFTLQCHTGAHREGQDEAGGHGTGGHAAGVEGDGAVHRGHEEAQRQGDEVAGDDVVGQGEVVDDADHAERDGRANADTQADHHGLLADEAAGDVLDLTVQHMDGRLGQNDENAGDQTEADQEGGVGGGEGVAQLVADGHEAHVDTGQEQHQTDVGQDDTHGDALQPLPGELQESHLAQQEEHHDHAQSDEDLLTGVHRGVQIGPQDVGADGVVGDRVGQVIACEDAQNENCQHGAHGAERNEAEAVVLAARIAQNTGDTDAQCHDEGHGDGAGGDAAGVEGHGQQVEVVVHRQQQSQGKQQHVEEHQDHVQALAEDDLQHRHHQECADAEADGVDQQRAVHDRADLTRQHLQVRLRDRDEHTQHEAHEQQQTQLTLLGQAGAHMGAHGGHGQVGAQIEQSDAQNQKHRTDGKGDELDGRKVEQGSQAHHIHQGGDGQSGDQSLQDLVFEFLQFHHLSFIDFYLVKIYTIVYHNFRSFPTGFPVSLPSNCNQIPQQSLEPAAQLGQAGVVHGLHQTGVLGQLDGPAAVQDLRHELGAEILVLPVEGDAHIAQDQTEDVEAVLVGISGELLGLGPGGLIDILRDGQLIQGAGDVAVLVVEAPVEDLGAGPGGEHGLAVLPGGGVQGLQALVKGDGGVGVGIGRKELDQLRQQGVGAGQQDINGFHSHHLSIGIFLIIFHIISYSG